MLDTVNSKKKSQFLSGCPYLVCGTERWRRNSDSREHGLCLERCLLKLLHSHAYSALRMYPKFVNIQRQTTGEDGKQERKILSTLIKQNAPLEKKIQWVYFCLIDTCMLIKFQGKGMWKIAYVAEKKSHLPVLFMSIPLTSPYTGKYTSMIPYNHYSLLN